MRQVLAYLTLSLLLFQSLAQPGLVLAQGDEIPSTASAVQEPERGPESEPVLEQENPEPLMPLSIEASPSATTDPTPIELPPLLPDELPVPAVWAAQDGAFMVEKVELGVQYMFPPNPKMQFVFSRLPDGSGSVTARESGQGVELTSSMPNGTFSFDLTLPLQREGQAVLMSDDGRHFIPLEGKKMWGVESVTVKDIDHLTHFLVSDEAADYRHVLINEFFVDGTNEWVELYNPTDQAIDVTGWILDDDGGSSTIYVFGSDPGDTEIAAKDFLVIEDNFGLNDSGDTARLLDDGENTIDERAYASDPGTSSIGRIIDGGSDWTTFPVPTQGVSNGGVVSQLYVDDDWTSPGNAGGHTWGFDAFNSIQEAINFAPEGRTINISAGVYEESLAINKSLTLLGDPGDENAGTGPNAPEIVHCGVVVSVEASQVTVRGLLLNGNECGYPTLRLIGFYDEENDEDVSSQGATISENEMTGGGRGINVRYDTSGNLITNNLIHNNNTGISISSSINNTISENQIENNSSDGMLLREGEGDGEIGGNTIEDNTLSGNGYGVYVEDGLTTESGGVNISNNTIAGSANAGIYLGEEISSFAMTGNSITDNGVESLTTGIVLYSALGNEANRNIISGNGVGVENNDSENFFDATENYWGHSSGPFHEDINSEGQGDSISGMVLFSPFFTDDLLTATKDIDIGTSDISSFVENGIFDLPSDEEGELLVRFLTILQKIEFEAFGDGENDASFPAGTRIERSDDLEFEWDDLSMQDIDEAILSGFDADDLIEEAIQWGIPNVELEFSQPISISISVGTNLNGQTLNVARSTSGTGGWTSSGIVTPATCGVTGGVCSFQATKASYFAATRTTTAQAAPALSSSTTSVSSTTVSSSPPSAPTCTDQKPGSAPTLLAATAGTNTVTLTWSKAASPVSYYLVTYGFGPGLQQFGNPNVGGQETTTYTVGGLRGGTTYYFQVRAGNGCAPGSFSNELSATPQGSTGVLVSLPAPGFTPGVLGKETDEVQPVRPGIEESMEPLLEVSSAPPSSFLRDFWQTMSNFFQGIGKFFHNLTFF